jgi:hypothetical protein
MFGKYLYHGTPHGFNPGDVILPAKSIGKRASSRDDVAYASPDFGVAKFMAWEQNNHNGENFREDADENPPSERVFRVAPVDNSEKLGFTDDVIHTMRPELPEGMGMGREVTSAKGFTVLSEVNDPDALKQKFFETYRRKERAIRVANNAELEKYTRTARGKGYTERKSRNKLFGEAIGKSALAKAAGKYGMDTRQLKG